MKKDDYMLLLRMIWKPVLQGLLTILTLIYVHKSFITILLSILVWQYIFSIFTEPPKIKAWSFVLFWTALFIGGLNLIALGLGWFGAVGALLAPIIILLAIAGWKIKQNWKVYDAVTTWCAERIKGKHKKDFNLAEAMKK